MECGDSFAGLFECGPELVEDIVRQCARWFDGPVGVAACAFEPRLEVWSVGFVEAACLVEE